MLVNVVGRKLRLDYVNKRGQASPAMSLYCELETASKGVDGIETVDYWIREDVPGFREVSRVELPVSVDVLFNRYGNVDELRVMSD